MIRFLAGGLSALLLAAAGLFLWTGGDAASVASRLPRAPAYAASPGNTSIDTPPAASEATREERRFARYDRDKDGSVGREEYLASRRKAFARADLDHDGKLSFDEYAAKTIAKFASADGDKSGALAADEFAKTRVVRKDKPRCPPVRATAERAGGADDEG